MKKQILFEITMLIILLSVLPFAHSAGFYDADIYKTGDDFSEISNIYTGEPDPWQAGCTWYTWETAIFTMWDHGGEENHWSHCFWVQYGAELTAGHWRIGLNAINSGVIKSSEWYPNFEVLIEIGGPSGHLTSKVIKVPASDTKVKQGSKLFKIPADGWYSIIYTWLNDKSEGCDPHCIYDVNIMIDSVFFDKSRRSRDDDDDD